MTKEFNFKADDLCQAFVNQVKETQDSIINEINKLTGDDESENYRIQRIVSGMLIKLALSNGIDSLFLEESINPELSGLDDKQPSYIETCLAAALGSSATSELFFKTGHLLNAFSALAFANQLVGMAQGVIQGGELKELEMEIEKKLLHQSAAAVRHAENRSMKEEAIKHYKDNHTSFTSKDDAAFKIAENIVSAKFATVRGWLKGVNTE